MLEDLHEKLLMVIFVSLAAESRPVVRLGFVHSDAKGKSLMASNVFLFLHNLEKNRLSVNYTL